MNGQARRALCAAVCALLLTLAGCTSPAKTRMLEEDIQLLEQKNAALLEDMRQMEISLKTVSDQSLDRTAREQRLLDSLMKQIDLIPADAELGGKFYFYRDLCRILSEKYAYAYAEDGHVYAEMLLNYYEQEDGTALWALVAFDTGGGWTLTGDQPVVPSEQVAEEDEPQVTEPDESSQTSSSQASSSQASSSQASSSQVSSSQASSSQSAALPDGVTEPVDPDATSSSAASSVPQAFTPPTIQPPTISSNQLESYYRIAQGLG